MEEDRLLPDEVLADLMNEECPNNIARLVIRVRNLQDAKTASIKDAEWEEKFNQAVSTMCGKCDSLMKQAAIDAVKQANAECQERVERIIDFLKPYCELHEHKNIVDFVGVPLDKWQTITKGAK